MKRSILTRVLETLFFASFFVSCSHIKIWGQKEKKQRQFLEKYQFYAEKDYVDHLRSLRSGILSSQDIGTVKVTKKSERYLVDLGTKISSSNELLINKEVHVDVHIIKSLVPFHFSLPDGNIFISLGLLKKYVKYESLLASILTYELIKSSRNVYNRNIVIPTGFISIERAILLNRLPLEHKMELNKWTFYALKRSGFDPYSCLAWIQLLNKNTLEFSTLLGDKKAISREETLLKAFIVDRGLSKAFGEVELNSSSSFYEFINEIKSVEV